MKRYFPKRSQSVFGNMLIATLFLAFLGVANVANAVIIDFNSLEIANNVVNPVPSPYVEDGFQISGQNLGSAGVDNQAYAGSAGMHDRTINGTVLLEIAAGGSPFNLNSIELSLLDPSGVSSLVTFTGTLFGGGTVFQAFQTTVFAFQQFNFNITFSNLAAVSWVQGTGVFNNHQFDNVNVDVVPEASTLLLLASGLAGLGFFRMRRKREA